MDLINKYLSEENKDTGWKAAPTDRKDKYGNPVKTSNVAKSLARKAMKSAMSDLKKGPEAGKRQVEEVEELDELKKSTLASYAKKAVKNVAGRERWQGDEEGRYDGYDEDEHKKEDDKLSNRKKNIDRAIDRLAKEEVEPINELDEEIGYSPRGHRNKATEHFNKAKKLYQKADSAENRGDSSSADHYNDIAGKHATAYRAHEKASTDPKYSKEAHEASKEANSMIVDESVELDEAETSKLYNYAFDKYADITSGKNKKDKAKAPGYERIARNAFKMGISRPMKKPNLPEETELEEALRHEIAGAVAQFIGNKIDPVHGEIMRVHGREGYRQAATHIRKTISDVKDAVSGLHDRLHKQLRTGGLASEEVQQVDELKKSTLTSYADKAEKDIKAKKAEFKAQGGQMRKKSQRALDSKISNRYKGLFTALRKVNLPTAFKEEVEELDEGLKSKLAAMGVAATMAASPAAARVTDGGQSFAQQTAQQTTLPQSVKAPKEIPSKSYLQNVASGKSRSMMHPDTAKDLLKKHYSEEVDLISKYSKLGEAKYPGFRVRTTSGTFGGPKLPRRPYVSQGDKDPRTGLPLGFTNPPKSDKPENEKDKVKK